MQVAEHRVVQPLHDLRPQFQKARERLLKARVFLA